MMQEVKVKEATGIEPHMGNIYPEEIWVKAMAFAGQNAGVCCSKESFPEIKTSEDEDRCIERAKKYGRIHQSIHDHMHITFELKIPKFMAMILNSINVYNTSEKSSRYVEMEPETKLEMEMYNKWNDTLKDLYMKIFTNAKESDANRFARENARYMLSVFVPTMQTYTISFRQVILLALHLKDLSDIIYNERNFDCTSAAPTFCHNFYNGLSIYSKELSSLLLSRIGVNEINMPLRDIKMQHIRFLDYIYEDQYQYENRELKKEHILDSYTLSYTGSLAMVAQLQRHRSIRYSIRLPFFNQSPLGFYTPPILLNKVDNYIIDKRGEWQKDIVKISNYIMPQGTLCNITEQGIFEDFALKCKERLCSRAQLEVRQSTKDNLQKFIDNKYDLCYHNRELIDSMTKDGEILPRCMFDDFTCNETCDKGDKLSTLI